jgi:hypothetical protein
MTAIDFKQLAVFNLAKGAHDDPAEGVCAMEAVAWLEGLPHSDSPACTCPVVAAYVRAINDRMPPHERQRLVAYLPRLVGTTAPAFEQARGDYLAWAVVTIFAPNALRSVGKNDQADQLQALPLHDFAAARTLLRSWGYSSYYAADAYADAADAYAATYAADAAAYAADAAAYAAAYAESAAAYAADAATYAADAAAYAAESAAAFAAVRRHLRRRTGSPQPLPSASATATAKEPRTPWSLAFDALDGVLAIGPVSPGFSVDVAARVDAFRMVLAGAEAR